MRNPYYSIWADCIHRGRSLPQNARNWKSISLTLMTTAMTINLVLIMSILQHDIIGTYFYKLRLSGLPAYLNNIVQFVLLFVAPCLLVNYLLIFRGERYRVILEQYPDRQGKLFLTYFMVSLFLPLVLVFAGMIWART